MTVNMDRTYGVSASDLRGDSYNQEEVERRNAMQKANKESREFNKIIEYTSEVAMFANEMNESPFAKLSEKGKAALITVVLRLSDTFPKEQKVYFFFKTEIDTAKIKSKNLKDVQEDVLGFLSDLEEVVIVAESNSLINKTAAFMDLKKALGNKLEEKRVEKYMKVADGMDKRTVQTLVKKGFLK